MSDNENKVNELNETLNGIWDSLTDEQKEEAKNCKNMDELLKLAGKYRIELPDELLEQVAGGLIVKRAGWFYIFSEDNLDECLGMEDRDWDVNTTVSWLTTRPMRPYKNISRKVVSVDEYRAMGGKYKWCM